MCTEKEHPEALRDIISMLRNNATGNPQIEMITRVMKKWWVPEERGGGWRTVAEH